MLDPEMSSRQRIFRLAFFVAWVVSGYWMGGPWGAFAMFLFLGFGYWIFSLVNGIVQGVKRMTEPKIVVDNRTLNMNVEHGSAIKGTPVTVVHPDPTRPDRELTTES